MEFSQSQSHIVGNFSSHEGNILRVKITLAGKEKMNYLIDLSCPIILLSKLCIHTQIKFSVTLHPFTYTTNITMYALKNYCMILHKEDWGNNIAIHCVTQTLNRMPNQKETMTSALSWHQTYITLNISDSISNCMRRSWRMRKNTHKRIFLEN